MTFRNRQTRPRPLSLDERVPLVFTTQKPTADGTLLDPELIAFLKSEEARDQAVRQAAEKQQKQVAVADAPIHVPAVSPVKDYPIIRAALPVAPQYAELATAYFRYQDLGAYQAVLTQYDADEVDEAWLQAFNAKLAKGSKAGVPRSDAGVEAGASSLSLDRLESLMHRLELLHFEALQARAAGWQPDVKAGKVPTLPSTQALLSRTTAVDKLADIEGGASLVRAVWTHWLGRRQEVGGPLLPHLWLEEPWKSVCFRDPEHPDRQGPMPFMVADTCSGRGPGTLRNLTGREAWGLLTDVRSEMEALRTLADQVRKRERLKKQLLRIWKDSLDLGSQADGSSGAARRQVRAASLTLGGRGAGLKEAGPSTAGSFSTGRKRSREQTPTAQSPAHLSLKPQVQQQSPSSPWPGLQSAGFSRSGRRYTNINSPLSGSGTPAAVPGSLWRSGTEGLGKRPARRGRRLAAMQDQAAEHHRGVEQQARRPTSNGGGAKAQGIAAQLLSGLLPARPADALKGHRASRQAEKAQTLIPFGPQGQNASTDRPPQPPAQQAQPLHPPAPLLQPQPRRQPQSKRGEAGSGLENQAASHHTAVELRETGPPSMAPPRQQGPGPPKRGHHALRQAAGAGCVRPRRQLSPSCRAAWFAPPPQPSGITSWGHRSAPDAAGALPGAGVLGRMNPSHRSQALKGPLMEPLAIGQGRKAVQLSNGHGAECRKKQPGASLLGKQAKRRGGEGGEVEANGRADDHGSELHEDMLSLGPSGGLSRSMQGKRNSVAARSQQGPLRSRQPREDSEAAGNSGGARGTKRVRHEAIRADATGTANGRTVRSAPA
ncbi:hypothetical protein V8C86DRAFT_2517622 [Haematococcus lacustris]